MKLEQLQSGLVVPEQKKEPPPVRGPLEFDGKGIRQEIAAAIQVLRNNTRSGGILCSAGTKEVVKARRAMVDHLSVMLLGHCDYEELC